MGRLLTLAALMLLCTASANAQNGLAKDWKRAVWRVPLHIALSVPVVAATVVVPPVGKKYVKWRTRAEAHHAASGSDTPQKATIDLYTQTVLVRHVLHFYHVRL